MRIFWILLLGLAGVFGAGLVFWLVFYMVTSERRHELEMAADMEYEEMRTLYQRMSESNITFARRSERMASEAERRREHRMMTDAGKTLRKLEETGKWCFMIGALIAIVVLTVYLRVS